MGDGSDSLQDSDDSEPAWLRQAAHASVAAEGEALPSGATLCDGRFRIERRLGQGGMGVVYAAQDAERGERVALKTLPEARPTAVYRIKQEFRSLADVRHENLVRLRDLFEDGGRWFFTMDLIDGVPLGAQGAEALRPTFAQLAAGIEAIHRAGKLHRDLKPGNVLVDDAGHVVILDFGLAADPEPGGVGQTVADGAVSGTPAYMAPEQAAGKPATAASDWYALGVMLYEALCGRLPFEGSSGEVMALKQTRDPEPPSTHAEGVDAELEALCMRLLSRDPAQRPDAAAVRVLLGTGTASSPTASVPQAADVEEPFVGRGGELEQLRAAYHATDGGKPVRLLVSGLSGVGKSTLCERFLAELSHYGDALVLSGRCYEREQVPYKALDAIVDALSRHLTQLPEAEALALLPPSAPALGKLFPALARLPLLSRVRRRGELPPDGSVALERLAFEALRELFGRIAAARPLVLYVDDLQWGDIDSARLLAELLAPPEPPPLLVLGTYRSDEAEGSPMLRAMFDMDGADPLLDRRTLALENLAAADARALATLLGASDEAISAIARASEGHPLFVQALARGGEAAELSQVIEQAIAALDPASRRLLQLLALAGRPVTRAAALSAAEASGDGHAQLDALIAQRLLRAVAGEGAARVMCYHDRIREVAAAQLAGEARAAAHAAWARVYAEPAHADDEARVVHLLGSGEAAEAAALAARAAADAARAMAHGLASRLYRLALDHGQQPLEERRRLLSDWADVLSRQERSAETAEVLRALAALSEPREAEKLELEAAVLTADEPASRALLEATLGRLDIGPERQPAMREALAARDHHFVARDPAEIDPDRLHRLELMTLLLDWNPRHSVPLLLEALEEGSIEHASRGLLAAVMSSATDVSPLPVQMPLFEQVGAAAEAAGSAAAPPDLALRRSMVRSGLVVGLVEGRSRTAARELEAAIERYERTPGGGGVTGARTLHVGVSARSLLTTLWETSGQYRKFGQALVWQREARERGDRRDSYSHRVFQYLLAADEPNAALAVAEAAVPDPALGDNAMLTTRLSVTWVRMLWYLWNGYARRASEQERLERWQADAEHHPTPLFCIMGGNLFLGLAEETTDRGRRAEYLARAEQCWAEASDMPHLVGFRTLGLAQLHHLRGEHTEARALLEQLAADPDPEVGAHQCLPAMRRLGELEGGSRGAAMIAEADERLKALGFKRPDRWTLAASPAFGEPR